MLAAVLLWAMGASRLHPSSSWFLILLAEMPLQSSLCLPTLHSILPALCGSTPFLLFSAAHACMHLCRACIRVNGPDFCRGHFGRINTSYITKHRTITRFRKIGLKFTGCSITDGEVIMLLFYNTDIETSGTGGRNIIYQMKSKDILLQR